MKSFPKYANFLIVFLLIFGLSACGAAPPPEEVSDLQYQSMVAPGAVMSVGLGATVQALGQVAKGAPGTFIYATEGMKTVVLGWPMGSNYGFFALGNKAGLVQPTQTIATMMNGNKVNTITMSKFIKDLEAAGWKRIDPQQLPAPILVAMQGAKTWLATMASINPVLPIFFMPSTSPVDLAPLPPL